MGDICEQCGEEYKSIAVHWSKSSSCNYPSLTDEQMEIAIGLAMGDGYINPHNKNPYIRTRMISPNYLEYVNEKFGIFGNGVSLYMTAAESAKQNRDSGFRPDAKEENYSDMYRWRSMSHPDLQSLETWYDGGEKVWPEDIDLTPTVLKHWYCGDGCYSNKNNHNHIVISMSNEVENTNKVDKYFERANLPSPSNYDIRERHNGNLKCDALWTVDASEELFEYMGEPLPDFEYKWPEEYR